MESNGIRLCEDLEVYMGLWSDGRIIGDGRGGHNEQDGCGMQRR